MRKTAPASPRVLLVDDNRDGLKIRKIVLEQHGYEVVICESGSKAIDAFSASSFHVVVTDYRMPEMNGDSLIARLREIRPGVPVVLISGLVEALGLDEKNTGANAVVSKNSTEIPNLLRSIERLLRPPAPRKPAAAHVQPITKRVIR